MTINDFLGNDILKETFLSYFKNKKVPHSIILEGTKGYGKKTFAKIIAQNIMCNFANPISCEKCKDCKKILDNVHPDLIYPEKSGTLNTFNVLTVRKIRKDAYIMPNESDYKIYVFSDSDNINVSAQNALLKIIEEPPKNVIFIFTCESSKTFLDTIRSRSQIFRLEMAPNDKALKLLKSKFDNVSEDILKKSLRLSCGNIGKAIDLLKDDKKDELLLAEEILKKIVIPSEYELLKVSSKIKNDRESFKLLLKFLFNFLRESFEYSIDNNIEANEVSKNIAEKISIQKIMNLIDLINENINLLNKNANYNLLLTYFISNLYGKVFSS